MLLLVALNGFFVAGEFSLLTMASQAGTSTQRPRNVEALLSRLNFHLGGAQLGITLTSLVLGIIAESTVGQLLDNIGGPFSEGSGLVGVTAVILAAVFQMAFGELAPKNLAVTHPHQTSRTLAPLMRIYGVLAAPVVLLFNGIANLAVRSLGLRPAEELRVVRSLEELEQVLRVSSDTSLDEEPATLSEESARLLGRSLRLANKVAADALLPRTAMATLPADASVADLAIAAAEKGHTRFLVTGNDIDEILGLVDVRDAFGVAENGSQGRDWDEVAVREIMRKVLAVSEQMPLDRVLLEIEQSQNRLAVVFDEHGGTAGLVTREDIFEEVFGNLEDEYDQPARNFITPTQRSLSGNLTRDEVSEALGVALPKGPYETLAGFVLWLAGDLPAVGEAVNWKNWRFEVAARDGLRVAEVAVSLEPTARSEDPS